MEKLYFENGVSCWIVSMHFDERSGVDESKRSGLIQTRNREDTFGLCVSSCLRFRRSMCCDSEGRNAAFA